MHETWEEYDTINRMDELCETTMDMKDEPEKRNIWMRLNMKSAFLSALTYLNLYQIFMDKNVFNIFTRKTRFFFFKYTNTFGIFLYEQVSPLN